MLTESWISLYRNFWCKQWFDLEFGSVSCRLVWNGSTFKGTTADHFTMHFSSDEWIMFIYGHIFTHPSILQHIILTYLKHRQSESHLANDSFHCVFVTKVLYLDSLYPGLCPWAAIDLLTLTQLWFMSWWRHQMETSYVLLAICAGNSPVMVNSSHKGQWRGALMFSLICVWIKGWVNNREAGDLRRYSAHYDVTVMNDLVPKQWQAII